MLFLLPFLTFFPSLFAIQDINLSSYTGTQVTSIYGIAAYHYFGHSVSHLGDINGDQIDDFIIGAPQLTSASSNLGWSYIIYGTKGQIPNINIAQSFSSSQGFRIRGNAAGDSFGWCVNAAGDVNADGFADMILGSINASPLDNGKVSIIYGKASFSDFDLSDYPNLDTSHLGFQLQGSANYDYLGNAVASAGDINGDGIDDVIAAAAMQEGIQGQVNSGMVYVIYGIKGQTASLDLSNAVSNIVGFRISGSDANELLGSSVSGVGDINGDGIDDILIGAERYRYYSGIWYRNDPGIAYMIFGRKTGFSDISLANGLSLTQGFKVLSTTAGNRFGRSVSGAGDINADGINDFVIGAFMESPNGRSGAGTVYVIFGRKDGFSANINLAKGLSNSEGFQIYGASAGDNLGFAVKSAGDMNDDGVSDIVIGALRSGSTSTTPVVVYVIFGQRTKFSDIDLADGLGRSQGFKIEGLSAYSELATPISFAGDVNRDGVDDIILGAALNQNSYSGDQTGGAYIIYGTPISGRKMLETIAQVQGVAQQVVKMIAVVLCILNFSNAGALWFGYLAGILTYMKYMSLEYPTNLQFTLDQPVPQLISLDFILSPPSRLQDYLTEYTLKGKFETYDFNSSFLINFWSSIITIAFLLACILMVLILIYATHSKIRLQSPFRKLKEALKWNYVIAIFTGFYGDIALYTYIEVTSTKFKSFLEVISFLLCMVANIAAIAVLVGMWRVVKRLVQQRKGLPTAVNSASSGPVKQELQDYQVIFKSFKDKTIVQQGYMIIFCFRLYFFYAVIGYLYEHPIVQSVIINLIGFGVLIYLALARPFKNRVDLISSIAQELILAIVNACVFCLSLSDPDDVTSDDYRTTLGGVIIWCNTIFMAVGIVYVSVLIAFLLKDPYKLVKAKCAKKRKKTELCSPQIQISMAQSIEPSFVLERSDIALVNNNNAGELSFDYGRPIRRVKKIKDKPTKGVSFAEEERRPSVKSPRKKSHAKTTANKQESDSASKMTPKITNFRAHVKRNVP